MGWASFNAILGSLFFPAFCRNCQTWLAPGGQTFFCPDCWRTLSLIENYCACCGLPVASQAESLICGECRKKAPPFRKARAVALYDEGILRQAVHLFKYSGNIGLGKDLGQLMADNFLRHWSEWEYDFVLPVPLHPRRLREREFNQSFILANTLGRHFGTPPLSGNLERVRPNPPQAGLKQRERLGNVKSCFSLKQAQTVAGKKLLLVDDVYTTGATAGECALVLKAAGAALVDVYTLGRA